MADLNFKLIFKAIDQATAPVRRIGASLRGLTEGMRRAKPPTRELAHETDGLAKKAHTAGDQLRRLREWIKGVGAAALKADGPIGKMTGKLGKKLPGMVMWGGGAILGFLGAAGAHVVKITAEFEQFEAQLVGTEGSLAGARKAMEWIQRFAEKTPYELSEVTNAFILLKGQGIDPTLGLLRVLGDAAGGMGKPLDAAVQMMLDAQMGEFERLKEFGILARVEGDKVKFSYNANNKAMVVTSKKSAAEITKALSGIFDSKFKGGMERQSKTFNGMLSNLADAFHSFEVRIGKAGLFDFMKGKLQKLLDWIAQASADGRLQAWAENISKSVVGMAEGFSELVTQVNWKQLGQDLVTIAEAITKVAEALRKMKFLGALNSGLQGMFTGGIFGGGKAMQEWAREYQKEDEAAHPNRYWWKHLKMPWDKPGPAPKGGAPKPLAPKGAMPAVRPTPAAMVKGEVTITIRDPGGNAEVERPKTTGGRLVVKTNRGLHTAGSLA